MFNCRGVQGPQDGPLDVTVAIRPGYNTVRVIQLIDLSEFMFVLHAAPDEVINDSGTPKRAMEREWTSYIARMSRSPEAETLRG